MGRGRVEPRRPAGAGNHRPLALCPAGTQVRSRAAAGALFLAPFPSWAASSSSSSSCGGRSQGKAGSGPSPRDSRRGTRCRDRGPRAGARPPGARPLRRGCGPPPPRPGLAGGPLSCASSPAPAALPGGVSGSGGPGRRGSVRGCSAALARPCGQPGGTRRRQCFSRA